MKGDHTHNFVQGLDYAVRYNSGALYQLECRQNASATKHELGEEGSFNITSHELLDGSV